MKRPRYLTPLIAITAALFAAPSLGQADSHPGDPYPIHGERTRGGITWDPGFAYESATLVVIERGESVLKRRYGPQDPISYRLVDGEGRPLADGRYSYQLRVNRPVPAEIEQAEEHVRLAEAARDRVHRRLVEKRDNAQRAAIPIRSGASEIALARASRTLANAEARVTELVERHGPLTVTVSGALHLEGGELKAQPGTEAEPAENPDRGGADQPESREASPGSVLRPKVTDDYVDGSQGAERGMCTGCDTQIADVAQFVAYRTTSNSAAPRFTVRDTSGSSPRSWTMRFVLAGADLSIQERVEPDTDRMPFRIEAASPDDSLYIAANPLGAVGIGTPPGGDLHILDDNPNLLFEDTDDDETMGIRYDFGVMVIEGNQAENNNGQNIVSIDEAAPGQSIKIAADGDVGLGTGSPESRLHIRAAAPELMLEDTDSGNQEFAVGISSTRDLFIVDRTSLTFPFLLRDGAPSSSLVVGSTGNLGAGTDSPGASLHVARADGTASVLVEETSGSQSARPLLELRNNGNPELVLTDSSTGATWDLSITDGGAFFIGAAHAGGGTSALPGSGEVRVASRVTARGYAQASSRELKDRIEPVDGMEILESLAGLEISEWSFEGEDPRHLGPMAEDFRTAFGLGDDDEHIALGDALGIALAAVQELQRELQERDAELAELRAEMAELRSLVLEGPQPAPEPEDALAPTERRTGE